MRARDFCFWLQGFFELNNRENTNLNAEQTVMIKNHLALVFKHEIDPEMGDKKKQDELNAIHTGIGGASGHADANILLRC